jgi:hypothetical protein
VKTSTARGVPLILGTLRYRTKIGSIEQGTIPAIPAGIEAAFAPALDPVKKLAGER